LSTIYLIDDDLDDLYLFKSALDAINPHIDCMVERSSTNAIQKLRTDESWKPSYIFLDLNLPRLEGKKVLPELKKIDRIKDVPVVIYTTSNYPGDIVECEQLGAAGYMVKPLSFTAMVSLLREVLKTLSRGDNTFFTTIDKS
jgi:CheY-like chemotaxis protein